jgi:hypothetical protein
MQDGARATCVPVPLRPDTPMAMHTRQSFAFLNIAVLFCAAFVGHTIAADRGVIELTLPRDAAADEAVWLQVHAGVLPHGADILISTDDGTLVGTVSPLTVPFGQDAGTYTVPLPDTAIANGRVLLHLAVEVPGASARAPRSGEVQSVELMYVPITR